MAAKKEIYNVSVSELYFDEMNGDLIVKFAVESGNEEVEINLSKYLQLRTSQYIDLEMLQLELEERDYQILATKNLKKAKLADNDIIYDINDYIDERTPDYDVDYNIDEFYQNRFESFF